MIKVGTDLVSVAYPTTSHQNLASIHHLIILVPANLDFSAATRQIWELAHATEMHVKLLGLCRDTAEASRLRRGLVTMTSLLQDGEICAEAKVDVGTNWVEALKPHYQAGDLIVCFAEQRTGLLQKPLSQILESNFKATVYILSGPAPQKSKMNKLAQIRAWLGSIAIVIGFGILQAQIIQLPGNWLQSILLLLSVVSEFWLIGVWGSQFR